MRSSRSAATWLIGAVLLAAGCGTDSVPTAVQHDVPRAELSLSAADKSARKAAHDSLVALRDSIRAVQKANRVASKAAYDAAMRDWNSFRKSWAEYRKANKGAVVDVLHCRPLPYAADAQVIGPDGGELHLGPHTLEFPKGVLDHEEVVSGEAPAGSEIEVTFSPHGLQFLKPAQLTLSYEQCMRPDRFTYRIVYVDGHVVLEFPPSSDDKTLKEVEAPIDHFSSYMIAY